MTATFSFVPGAAGTTVTWAMDGENNFFGKAIALVVGMDKLVGTDFERGLSALKNVVESRNAAPSRAPDSRGARGSGPRQRGIGAGSSSA